MTGCWAGLPFALALLACRAPLDPLAPAPPVGGPPDTHAPEDSAKPTDSSPDSAEDTGPAPCPTVQWVIHAEAWSSQHVRDLETLPDGDILVLGTYQRDFTLKPGAPDEVTLTDGPCTGAYEDTWLARIGIDGTIRWARTIAEGCYSTRGTKLLVTPQGDVAVAGHYWHEAVTIAPETPEATVMGPPRGGKDPWWALFSEDGTLKRLHVLSDEDSTIESHPAIGAAADGTIYLAGQFWGEIQIDPGKPWATTLTSHPRPPLGQGIGITPSLWLAAWNPDGSLRWARMDAASGEGTAQVHEIGAYGDEVVLFGRTNNKPTLWAAGTDQETYLEPIAGSDTLVARYDSAGGSLRSVAHNTYGYTGSAIITRAGAILKSNTFGYWEAEVGGTIVPVNSTAIYPVDQQGTPSSWVLIGDYTMYIRDMSSNGELIAISGEVPYRAGRTVQFGDGPEIAGPSEDPGNNRNAWGWYTFTQDGEPLCGDVFGSLRATWGQGVAVDHEGGLVLGATWWGKGVIGEGTPHELHLDTPDDDVVILRVAP